MSNELTIVVCSAASRPGGHYQQAIIHNDTIHVSGQLGVAPGDADAGARPVAEQVRHALGQIEAILRTVGCGLNDVVKATVYVAGIEHWDAANAAFAACFGTWKPARAIVPCGALHHGALVEIDAVAAIR